MWTIGRAVSTLRPAIHRVVENEFADEGRLIQLDNEFPCTLLGSFDGEASVP